MKKILLFLLVGVVSLYGEWGFFVSSKGEMSNIIDRLIWWESRGNPNAYNKSENSVGLMAITGAALVEYNAWHGSWLSLPELFDPTINKDVGSWYLTNYLLRYRVRNNIVQAVAAYNMGLTAVVNGWFPSSYLTAVIPWYWNAYKYNKTQVGCRTNCYGQVMIRLFDKNWKPPKMGE